MLQALETVELAVDCLLSKMSGRRYQHHQPTRDVDQCCRNHAMTSKQMDLDRSDLNKSDRNGGIVRRVRLNQDSFLFLLLCKHAHLLCQAFVPVHKPPLHEARLPT